MPRPNTTRALLLALALSPELAAAAPTHHHHASTPPADAPSNAGQKALARVQAERKALEARQAEDASTLKKRQAEALQARQRAQTDTNRQKTYATQTKTAEHALTTTQTRITALSADITTLEHQRTALETDIQHENEALQPLLPIAVRLSIAPDAALLAAPQNGTDSTTALSILGGFSRLTQHRAETLHTRQIQLESTRAALNSKQTELNTLLDTQTRERDSDAAKTRVATRQVATSEQAAQRAQTAVTEAMRASADLSAEIEAIVKKEAEAKAALEEEARNLARQHHMAQAHKAQAQARALSAGNGVRSGNGHAPVSGTLTTRWGQNTEAGPATGITYTAAAAAPVQSPCEGRIVFSGPFRSFGDMLILDCGQNYRFVLSGLGALTASSGQTIKKSALLGRMPGTESPLFIQLRHGTQIINPAPFL